MRAGVDVTRLFAHIRRDERLAAERHVTDQAFTHLQTRLFQIGDVVSAYGFRVKDARFVHFAVPFGERGVREVVEEAGGGK